MNYCCAAGNCDGCWRFWIRHARIRFPDPTTRFKVWPVVNQDTGDEDDGEYKRKGYVS